jgi:8-oxo-dGTP pyrophosphatase MutT (NUDIX family)
MEMEELKRVLSNRGIDFSGWGTLGQSKPIEKLLEEINSRESALAEIGGFLIREVSAVFIAVTYGNKTLKEDRAEWKTGDRPPRVRVMRGGASVAGKMIRGEDPLAAAARELAEEIQVVVDCKRFTFNDRRSRRSESYSFPGLPTLFDETFLSLELTAQEHKEEGYREETDDKVTYFVWE